MKTFLLFLFLFQYIVADDNAINSIDNNASNALSTILNKTEVLQDNNSTNKQISDPTLVDVQSNIHLSSDERLKNEIITFDRIDYIKENTSIADPFIYVYPQSEEDLAFILKIEQAVLKLNGIFEDKASINNIWVGKNDIVEGWMVSDIQKDRVELKFRAQTKVLYVYSNNSNIKIK